MTYTQSIIRNAFLMYGACTLPFCLFYLVSYGSGVEAGWHGLIFLFWAIVLGGTFLIIGLVLLIADIGTTYVPPHKDEEVLESIKPRAVRISGAKRAGAFAAAGGLLLLVGGSLCFGSLAIEPFNIH